MALAVFGVVCAQPRRTAAKPSTCLGLMFPTATCQGFYEGSFKGLGFRVYKGTMYRNCIYFGLKQFLYMYLL